MRKILGAVLVGFPVCFALADFVMRFGWLAVPIYFAVLACVLGGLYLLLEDQR